MREKRTVVLATALSMLLSAAPVMAQEYTDMPEGWSKTAIEYALNKGYIKGYDGKINPKSAITRAEAAAILERAHGLSEKADISEYTDVSADKWYYESISKAVAAGIIKGYAGKIRPEDSISREESMAVIARAYGIADGKDDLSEFEDSKEVSQWAKAAIAGLREKGIVSGDGKKLNPKSSITREEFVQLVYNCENNGSGAEHLPTVSTAPESTLSPTSESTASPKPTATPLNTVIGYSSGGGGSSLTKYELESKGKKLTIDGTEYIVAKLEKAMNRYRFTYEGKSVKPTAVNAEQTIVKYALSDVDLNEKLYAKTPMSYGEYWYTETSDGYKGELTTEFKKDAKTAQIPSEYTATQSGADKYGAEGADTDAGMYDAVTRATVGYGLGRTSFKNSVSAKTKSGETKIFDSSIKYENGEYTVVRPDEAAEEFGYNGSSNRGSNGEYTAYGYKEVTVAVMRDMLVNAEILKDEEGYSEQAKAVLEKAKKLSYDKTLTKENVYDSKELCANGLYGKRTVNENVSVKDIGTYSEANTREDNTFTVNTKYGRRYGDVTFLIHFDDYKDMKAESGYDKANINGDDKTAGKVGEFKNYVYNVTGAKIEYLGADGTEEPVVAGTKFGADVWISPNHGAVVEIAVTNSYDRFKAFGDGKYRITLMSDGYKDVVLETSAKFGVSDPLKMQGESDDVEEIQDGNDLVLNYDIVNREYVKNLQKALSDATAQVTLTEGKTTIASEGKLEVNADVLSVRFENVKAKLEKDTQYGVVFPTMDYNDTDKLGMTASIHYAPADMQTLELTKKIEINGTDYYYTNEKAGKYTLNGIEVNMTAIGETGVSYYCATPLSGSLYGTVNMPYADFYYSELNELAENNEDTPKLNEQENEIMALYRSEGYYDAVSCATTNKSMRYGASNTISETDMEGNVTKVTIDGIKDVPVAVNAKLYAEASILNASGLTETSENGILGQVKRIENIGTSVPNTYKTLYADGKYSALNAVPVTEEAPTASIETGIVWGDYELVLPDTVSNTVTVDNLAAAVIVTDNGSYAMRHSQNTWLKTNMMVWSAGVRTSEPHGNTLAYRAYEDMSGKTIKTVRYILNNDGVFSAVDYNVDLKVKHLLAKAGEGYGIASDGAELGAEMTTVAFEKSLPSDSEYVLSTLTFGNTAVEYEEGKDCITLTGEANKAGTYTAEFTDEKYEDVKISFKVTDTSLTNEMLSISDGVITIDATSGISAEEYAASVTAVTVSDGTNENTYNASGRGAVKLINADASIVADAVSGGNAVFAEGVEYTLTIKTAAYKDMTLKYIR